MKFLLFTVEFEDFALFEVALEVVVDVDGAYACGGASVEEVARLQGEELGDVGDDLVDLIKHIGGAAFLDGLTVDVEVEVDTLDVEELLLGNPLADGSRAVEALTNGPGLASLRGALLEVTGRKIYAYGQGVIITVGKALRDVLAQATDADDNLRLVIDATQMVGDKERLSLIQDGGVGFCKNHRLVRSLQRPVQFLVMGGIIHANSENLHITCIFSAKIRKKSALHKQCRFFFVYGLMISRLRA